MEYRILSDLTISTYPYVGIFLTEQMNFLISKGCSIHSLSVSEFSTYQAVTADESVFKDFDNWTGEKAIELINLRLTEIDKEMIDLSLTRIRTEKGESFYLRKKEKLSTEIQYLKESKKKWMGE